jgi:hypothetical protein
LSPVFSGALLGARACACRSGTSRDVVPFGR